MESRHFISIADINAAWWESLYSLYRSIISNPREYSDACRGTVMASLFYEPSTRTKFSFQSAMLRLGGSVFGFENLRDTSIAKGESFADTVRITSTYADVIVMRSQLEGAAKAASLYSEVPVVNAGDGGHLHPTQTLTDLAAIAQTRGKIGNFTIGLCGDLLYGRTVHSLVMALSLFPDIHYILISPENLGMPDYMRNYMRRSNMRFDVCRSIDEALPELDILYMTRIQKERFNPSFSVEYTNSFLLNKEKLNRAKKDLIVLHPLPRVNEVNYDVDSDSRAFYFEQARCGMYIRMALLYQLINLGRIMPAYPLLNTDGVLCRNDNCITQSELYLPAYLNKDGSCLYCDSLI